jgi:transposase-like protein
MTFKSTMWYRIAVALSALNLAGLGYAIGVAEPAHAAIHGVLAVGFWVWARRLWQGRGASDDEARLDAVSENESRLEALEAELNTVRQQLNETQERLDFTERVLARGPDARKVDPQR